jgi:prepilin-type N-terminal cleavage/methylation domain-containing protein
MKMLRISQRQDRAFTLVELMIVVAVIGVIASLAIPKYLLFTARTRRSEMLETVSKIKLSFKTAADNAGTFVSSSTVANSAGSSLVNPTTASIPVGQPDTWNTHALGWVDFQFPPDGPVRMRYTYTITNNGQDLTISVCGSFASFGNNTVLCPQAMMGNYLYREVFHTNGSSDLPVYEFPSVF